MGWSSGTQLMEEVIKAFDRVQSKLTHEEVDLFASSVVTAFEDNDWDNIDEVLGNKDWFDRGYYKANPYCHGLAVANEEEYAIAVPKPTDEKKLKHFEDGYRYGIGES